MSEQRSGCRGDLSALFLVLVCAGAALVFLRFESDPGPAADVRARPDLANKARPALGDGDLAYLGHPGGRGSEVWMCLDESAWDEMVGAQIEGGKAGPVADAGITDLAEAGKVRAYAVGTTVKILETDTISRKAKVEVREGRHAGDTGWVQLSLLFPRERRYP